MAADLPTVEQSVLGGMRAILWQHHLDCPDYNAMNRNPSGRLTPVPDPFGDNYECTCEAIGGFCP